MQRPDLGKKSVSLGDGIYITLLLLWVKKKQCKTKLERNAKTAALYDIIVRAENWLRSHNVTTPILKWDTTKWGEVPADFGRK